ncbi:hypothetical protein BCR34DRAFT_303883 [Clohesyomyces aquaticus]|uniref:Uncharacterized protein n=1 Tax=Clohesyomyces aquaticus TaxID=1231657 RepID=A0A1Y1ZRC6_9PLEO|nr:hypothetical protein BCR34DRAFT_303883 [Clohesyomyces aquaticus]
MFLGPISFHLSLNQPVQIPINSTPTPLDVTFTTVGPTKIRHSLSHNSTLEFNSSPSHNRASVPPPRSALAGRPSTDSPDSMSSGKQARSRVHIRFRCRYTLHKNQ